MAGAERELAPHHKTRGPTVLATIGPDTDFAILAVRVLGRAREVQRSRGCPSYIIVRGADLSVLPADQHDAEAWLRCQEWRAIAMYDLSREGQARHPLSLTDVAEDLCDAFSVAMPPGFGKVTP